MWAVGTVGWAAIGLGALSGLFQLSGLCGSQNMLLRHFLRAAAEVSICIMAKELEHLPRRTAKLWTLLGLHLQEQA